MALMANEASFPTLLDRAGRAADRTVRLVLEAGASLREGDQPQAEAFLTQADESSQAAYLMLLQLGAHVPETPGPREVPLHLLNTPATRALLKALRIAVECAEDVDRERKNVLPSGECIGMAEIVGDVCARWAQQVEGPRGRE